LLVVVVSGASVVHSVLHAVSALGRDASSVLIATHASNALVASFHKPVTECTCVVIIEALRYAVLAETRQGNASAQVQMHSNLLGLAELTVLSLDLNHGWRTRIHEAKCGSETVGFVRTLITTAREQSFLPLAA